MTVWLRETTLVTVVATLGLISVECLARVTITNPPLDVTSTEGGNADFHCAAKENRTALLIGWRFTPRGSAASVTLITGTTLTGIEMVTVSDGLRTMLTFSGVRREADGGMVVCVAVGSNTLVSAATLTVHYPPRFSPTNATETPMGGKSFTFSLSVEANPLPTSDNIMLTKNGVPVTNTRITVTVTSLIITDITLDDSGEYQITASNFVGSANFTLTVNVIMIINDPQDAITAEGGVVTYNCTAQQGGSENGEALDVGWQFTPSGSVASVTLITGTTLTGIEMVTVSDGLRSTLTFSGVGREANGGTVVCLAFGSLDSLKSDPAMLTVLYPPRFSPSIAIATTTEGDQFTFSLPLEAKPPPTSGDITLTGSGTPVTDTRVTVTAASLDIANITRGDSGDYQITVSNSQGTDTFTLTVNVRYRPEFAVPSQNVIMNAARNESFTFDCTPSGGNPAVYSYTFLKDSVLVTEGVSGSVLTINPVVRSSRGMYTCTANNTAGTAVVTRNLFVVDVPTMPLNSRVVDLMPFSATLQWDPPSDNGGSSLPLTYTVTLTNTSTSLPFSDITATSLPLPNIQHSTQYSWSVQAINEFHTSPSAVGTFTTPDSVPIIDSVNAMALSLFAFRVNITLLTDGSQRVTLYTIEIRGVNYTGNVEGSDRSLVSVLVNQLDQNFTKGETHTVRVFVTNSVGSSNPLSTVLQIPFPPNITALPTELSTTNIPVCCAGVQLNLAYPDNLIDVRVLVNGTLHPPNQVTRNGSFLYIMGLQAGTEYFVNITLFNILGTLRVNNTLRPLLGRPSTPQVTLTPTAGGLTVQLTVMYPGTEDTLQYSISTSPSSLSRRQTGQQPLLVTDLTTPTSGSAEVALGPGTYSVTVTVTNQHGSTMSVPQQVTIPVMNTEPPTIIISAVVAAIVTLLILTLAVFTVMICVRCKSTGTGRSDLTSNGVSVDFKDSHSHSEDVILELNPAYAELSQSTCRTKHQYENCGGATHSDVAMEENPAYQSVDVACTSKIKEPTYQNAQLCTQDKA